MISSAASDSIWGQSNQIGTGRPSLFRSSHRLMSAPPASRWSSTISSCDVPRIQQAEPTSESGRGLFVVDKFTRHWGVRPLAGDAGKVVFAVLNP